MRKLAGDSAMEEKNRQNELNNNKNVLTAQKSPKYAGKLAFYIGSLEKGGAERVFVNLAEYFQNKGYQIIMVTQYRKEEEYELAEGIRRILSDIPPEETTASRLLNFYRRVKRLHRIWKEEEPDLALSCVGKNNFMAIVTGLRS